MAFIKTKGEHVKYELPMVASYDSFEDHYEYVQAELDMTTPKPKGRKRNQQLNDDSQSSIMVGLVAALGPHATSLVLLGTAMVMRSQLAALVEMVSG
jgi:hypothetical protein